MSKSASVFLSHTHIDRESWFSTTMKNPDWPHIVIIGQSTKTKYYLGSFNKWHNNILDIGNPSLYL